MGEITAQLVEIAPTTTERPRSDTLTKAMMTPSYFASAWRTVAHAEANGQATPDQLAKATDTLHSLQYGAMMENVGEGNIVDARAHLATLTATGAFASPQQVARIEHTLNNPPDRSMIKARTPYNGPPALAQVVLADNWSAIPAAPHQP
jgi:hypothetical protein